jgi:hypothetical protein
MDKIDKLSKESKEMPPKGKYYESDSDSDMNAAPESIGKSTGLSFDDEQKVKSIIVSTKNIKPPSLAQIKTNALSANLETVRKNVTQMYEDYQRISASLPKIVKLYDQIEPGSFSFSKDDIDMLNNYVCQVIQSHQYKMDDPCLVVNEHFSKHSCFGRIFFQRFQKPRFRHY